MKSFKYFDVKFSLVRREQCEISFHPQNELYLCINNNVYGKVNYINFCKQKYETIFNIGIGLLNSINIYRNVFTYYDGYTYPNKYWKKLFKIQKISIDGFNKVQKAFNLLG